MIIVEENTIIVGAGGGSNVSSLDDLTDVDTTGVSGGEFLVYQDANPSMGIEAGWVARGIVLDSLANVDLSTPPSTGSFLGWDDTNNDWEAKYIPFRGDNVTLGTPAEADVLAYIAGDGGWVNHQLVLDDISDIDLTGVSAGNVLVYDTSGSTPKWVPGSPGTSYTAGEGIDISVNDEISIDVYNASNAIYELSTSSNGLSVSGPDPVYPLEATSSTISLLYDNKTIGINSGHELCTKSLSVTDSSTTVTISSLANNTIYRLTASGVESLSITGTAADFEYATIILTYDATNHSFGTPSSGWYCVGPSSCCSGGVFTPEGSMRYTLAIVNEGDRITVYVTEAS